MILYSTCWSESEICDIILTLYLTTNTKPTLTTTIYDYSRELALLETKRKYAARLHGELGTTNVNDPGKCRVARDYAIAWPKKLCQDAWRWATHHTRPIIRLTSKHVSRLSRSQRTCDVPAAPGLVPLLSGLRKSPGLFGSS